MNIFQKDFVKIEDENCEPIFIWNEGHFGFSETVHISWSKESGCECDTMIEMHLVPEVIKDLERRYNNWKKEHDNDNDNENEY